MRKAWYVGQTTILTVALVASAAACGSSASSDPLAGLTSKQIAQKAATGTEAASSVRIAGSGSDSGQTLTIDLTLVKGKGCQGNLSEGSAGSFKLVYTDGTVWMLPNSKFYQANNVPAAAATLLNGKWLKVKSSSNGLGSIAQLCTMSTLLTQFTGDASNAKGVKTTFNGQPAVKITYTKGYAYVTDTTPPQMLQVTDTSAGGGTINFTYGTTTTITTPPASQTIDGSKYGF